MPILNIAIIGAGAAGLASAKCALEQGFNVTIYEQNKWLGGIWHYTDKIGRDEYGVDVHTAMYQGLRTNQPHVIMEFPDFHYPEDTLSFPTSQDVLNYLHSYANQFDLKKFVKFNHLVIRVSPIEDIKWEIVVKNLPNNTFETIIFDAVFICTGHYAKPQIPKISGVDDFKGIIFHSHDFRTAEAFRDKSTLIIGSGPSGIDLVAHLSKVARRVTFSQRKVPNETLEQRKKRESILPPNTELQDDVKHFTPTGAVFIDGSHQTFDVVIYATGYSHSYRFLSADCGIHIDNNFVQPLYKQILNINYPTMALICIVSAACYNSVSDLQARFALKFISGAKKLPTKNEMLLDMRAQTQIHWDKGYPKHKTHFIGLEQRDYCKQLAETADIENIPDVKLAIFSSHFQDFMQNPFDIRKNKYNVIDDKTFEKIKYD